MNDQTGIRRNFGVMAACILLVSICSAAVGASAQPDDRLVGRVQQIQISRLDSALPPISLVKWLRIEAGADAEVSWEVNDCGEETGTPADRGRNLPICVEADAHMKDRRLIVLMVAVAPSKLGAEAKPVLYFGQLVTPHATITLRRLGDLPPALIKTHQLGTNPEIAQ